MRNELIERLQRQLATCSDSYEAPSGKIMFRIWINDLSALLKLAAFDTDDRIKELEARIVEGHGLMLAALGFYRDDMPPEAVKRFQELLTALKGDA